MKENSRKVLFVFTAVCFALAATNIALVLHMTEHEHDKGHYPKTCQICQQLFVLAKSQFVEEPTMINQALLCEESLILNIEIIPAISSFHILGPRAPPAYL